jgi:RNA polymerase sigma factor (sigma-70 family)
MVSDPAEDVAAAEERDRVRRALRRLGRRDRVLLSLVHVEDLPLAQAARFLDTPVTTLRRRLAAAVSRFRRSLEREGIRHAV